MEEPIDPRFSQHYYILRAQIESIENESDESAREERFGKLEDHLHELCEESGSAYNTDSLEEAWQRFKKQAHEGECKRDELDRELEAIRDRYMKRPPSV